MDSEKVRLYTRQNDKTLLMLQQEGRIVNQRIYVQMHFGDMAQHYLECYDWFARQAARGGGTVHLVRHQSGAVPAAY